MNKHPVPTNYPNGYGIVAYAPTTTIGSTTTGWSINIGIGAAGRIPGPLPSVGWIFTQTSSDVKVYDMSDFVIGAVYWKFDINQYADVGSNTFLTENALIITVP